MNVSHVFGTFENSDNGGHWLSVSDLMAGLMMLFLFIAITYMRYVQIERDDIKQVVVMANNTQIALYKSLEEEFADDLPLWNAELDQNTMTIRFNEPDILFDQNSDTLKPRFEEILSDFFPRYVAMLSKFEDSIEEVRIEGHTSSEWRTESTEMEAYFRNMDLSQRRTMAVLEYSYTLPGVREEHGWLKSRIAAVGLSSGRLITDHSHNERPRRSRRVEFTVKTNFEKKIIRQIIDHKSL